MQEEIWKPVVGWEEFYEVSSEGRVRSKDRVIEINDKHNRKYKVQAKGRILMQPCSSVLATGQLL